MMISAQTNASRARVVHVVDDDAAMRDSLQALLETHGFEVYTYPLARDFLDRHRDGYAGCLLVDVHMPEMTGIELVQALRAGGATGPAIVMTARGDADLRALAADAGAFAFLDKPIESGRLGDAIAGALTA